MEEIWKPIKDYETLYEVSNLGRVRSIDQHSVDNRGRQWFRPGRVISFYKNPKGYVLVRMFNRNRRSLSVHRLVAIAFIPNPEDKPQVNHINGIKEDNRVENLEWATALENNYHKCDVIKTYYKVPIIAKKLDTGKEIPFPSVNKAATTLHLVDKSIRLVLKGLQRHTGGYSFRLQKWY